MAKRSRWLISLGVGAVLALVGLCIYETGAKEPSDQRRNGLFNWSPVETEKDLTDLIEIMDRVGVGEVYQSYSETQLQDKVPQRMITELSKKNVDVWYVAGTPEWGLDDTGEEIRRVVSTVALYNLTVPEEARFAGIQLDVEPYLTDLWEEDKQYVMRLWYSSLHRGKLLAEQYGIPIMICVPRWMDAVNQSVFEDMIRDCCDQVAIMNYDRRDESEGIRAEMELAHKYGRPLICISELTPPGNHGLTDDHSYYNAGLGALQEAWRKVAADYSKNDLRFAYHHMEPLKEILNRPVGPGLQ